MATNKKLSAVITIGGAISSSLRGAFGDVKGRVGELGKTVTDLEKRQRLRACFERQAIYLSRRTEGIDAVGKDSRDPGSVVADGERAETGRGPVRS